VPDSIFRLRITVNAGITEPDWCRATIVLLDVIKGRT
jgi:hypothetical protein